MSSGPSNVTIARTMWVPFFFERIPLGLFFLVMAKCRICIFALSVVFAGRLWHSVFFQAQKGLCMFWMDTSAVSFFGLCSGFEFQSTDLKDRRFHEGLKLCRESPKVLPKSLPGGSPATQTEHQPFKFQRGILVYLNTFWCI